MANHKHPLIKTYPPLEEQINIWSHVVGLLLSVAGLLALVLRASQHSPGIPVLAVGIFGLSMVSLYAISALYHSSTDSRLRIRRRVYDHACIYVLIAGTYTPFALISLPPAVGNLVFLLVWGLALSGIILKIFFTGRFDLLSTLMYVAMGWMVVFFFNDFTAALTTQAMLWLAAGGVIYTLGAVMYSIERVPMGHAIFHLCVVLGSLCHYICIYFFVLPGK
ncbi:MAG TPA: hemolysin III family protein [Xanthomonadales bacterium]|nr:hemolysin III family protein [Xanthomonadales bacterium]